MTHMTTAPQKIRSRIDPIALPYFSNSAGKFHPRKENICGPAAAFVSVVGDAVSSSGVGDAVLSSPRITHVLLTIIEAPLSVCIVTTEVVQFGEGQHVGAPTISLIVRNSQSGASMLTNIRQSWSVGSAEETLSPIRRAEIAKSVFIAVA